MNGYQLIPPRRGGVLPP